MCQKFGGACMVFGSGCRNVVVLKDVNIKGEKTTEELQIDLCAQVLGNFIWYIKFLTHFVINIVYNLNIV